MDRKKNIFLIVSLFFILLMVYLAYDLARHTTRLWGKKQLHRIGELP